MAKQVVFILSSAVNQNGIKRIDEFCERGYMVTAYGFKRDTDVDNKPKKIRVDVVGTFSNNMPYMKRIGIMRNGISKILRKHEGDDCVYYAIGTDVAIIYALLSKKTYIYEEPDLVHTYIKYGLIRKLLERLDKWIIRRSVLTVFRSEGFIRYHFGCHVPSNVTFIANRLTPDVQKFPTKERHEPDMCHLKFGFVGAIRFKAIYNFAKVVVSNYPQHEFHFYGSPTSEKWNIFNTLKNYKNCFFHGKFHNPDDLPEIYGDLDLVLSTYDVEFENVRYAEPNKIYEAIYFETPIIVSKGTFLGEKVEMLGIGYTIDAFNDEEVKDFVEALTKDDLLVKVKNAQNIDKIETLNINNDFFERIKTLIK